MNPPIPVSHLPWGNAVVADITLPVPDLVLPLSGLPLSTFPEILQYAQRDRVLAYRDLVVAGNMANVSLLSSTIWGSPADRVMLPALVGSILYNGLSDKSYKNTVVATNTAGVGNGTTAFSDAGGFFLASHVGKYIRIIGVGNFKIVTFVSPTSIVLNGTVAVAVGLTWEIDGAISQVTYAQNSDRPLAALDTDKDLYTRDVIIQEAVHRMGMIFSGSNPVPAVEAGAFINDAWANAFGAPSTTEVAPSRSLDRSLFLVPDRNLTDRDNLVAFHAAVLNKHLYNVLEHADRLYVQIEVNDPRDAEVYVLAFDSNAFRVWAAEPFLPGRLVLVYNKVLKTLMWITELATQYHIPQDISFGIPGIEPVNPLVVDGILVGQKIEVLRQVPDRYDSQWYRQKSARINPNSSVESPQYYSASPAAISSTGVDQFDAASLTAAGTLQFTVPPIPDGDYQLYLHARPSGTVRMSGAQNTLGSTGASYGVDYTGGVGQSVSWHVVLPSLNAPDAWVLSFKYTNLTASPMTMSVLVTWNASSVGQVLTFNVPPGTLMDSSPLLLSVPGAFIDGTVDIQLTTLGSGLFHIREVKIESTGDQSGYFLTNCMIGTQTKEADVFGKRNRADVLAFPFTITGNPTLITFNWTNNNQMGLVIPALELKAVSVSTPTPNTSVYAGWRTELVERAGVAVADSYRVSTTASVLKQEFRILNANASTAFAYVVESQDSDHIAFTATDNVATVVAPDGAFQAGDQVIFFPSGAIPVTRALTSVSTTDGVTTLTTSTSIATGASNGACVKSTLAPSFSATGLPTGLTISATTGLISGAPSPASSGTYAVVITSTKGAVVSTLSMTLVVGTGLLNPFAWTSASTEAWMNSIEVVETRLRQAFRIARPGDVGRPALVPEGLQFTYTGIRANYTVVDSIPTIRALQPWMLDAGVYVAHEDFWSPTV